MNLAGKVTGHQLKVEKMDEGDVEFLALTLELEPHPLRDEVKGSKAVVHLPVEFGKREFPLGARVNLQVRVPQQSLDLDGTTVTMESGGRKVQLTSREFHEMASS